MRFEDLDVWKRSAALCAEVYKEFKHLNDFGFKDQVTRSCLSVSSNIAEGFERYRKNETVNLLNYAKGSAGEFRSQVYIAIKIGYVERETGNKWIREITEISKMISGLMKTVKSNLSE